MRILYLLFFLLGLSGCTNTPEPQTSTQTVSSKILTNTSEAQRAQYEYKVLQDQRTKG